MNYIITIYQPSPHSSTYVCFYNDQYKQSSKYIFVKTYHLWIFLPRFVSVWPPFVEWTEAKVEEFGGGLNTKLPALHWLLASCVGETENVNLVQFLLDGVRGITWRKETSVFRNLLKEGYLYRVNEVFLNLNILLKITLKFLWVTVL